MKYGLWLVFWISFCTTVFAQQPVQLIDSLQKELNFADDTTQISILLQLAKAYESKDIQTSKRYTDKAMEESLKLDDKKWLARAHLALGGYYTTQSEYALALKNQIIALEIAQKHGLQYAIANAYNNIGIVYNFKADYDSAIHYYTKALRLFEQRNDSTNVSFALNNIGIVYKAANNLPKALQYYTRALALQEQLGNLIGTAVGANNIGRIHEQNGDLDTAYAFYQKALKICKELDNKEGLAIVLGNVGKIHQLKSQYNEALTYYKQAKAISESMGDKSGIANQTLNKAVIYRLQNRLPLALNSAKKGLLLAQSIGNKNLISAGLEELSKIYSQMGNYKDAYAYYMQHTAVKDSIYNSESSKQIADMEARYQSEKKEKRIAQLSRQKEVQEVQLTQQRTQRNALVSGSLLLLVLALVVFRSYQQKKKANVVLSEQKDEIEEQRDELSSKNRKINESIDYAQRIQNAILTPQSSLEEVFPDSFIFFKPRDVVSGDFYWMRQTANGKTWLAAADCTGHGVPGAFMSLIAVNVLTVLVQQYPELNPSAILNKMEEDLQKRMRQKKQGKVKGLMDGLDIALCSISADKKELLFAGAHHPLFLIRKESLEQYNGNPMSIGYSYYKPSEGFSDHSIPLVKGDCIYIFTDGYVDQFGGPSNKKFMNKPFKQLLLDHHHLSMHKQSAILEKEMQEWMGSQRQIDDMLIVGVRV